ncbi:MAG: GEVED domain-containing protein [Crocinitomicaceae bacterium]
MKKLITLSILFSFLILGCTKDDFTWNIKKRACYIKFYNSSEDYFSLVDIAGMSNSTVGTGPNNYYEDQPITLKAGQTYDLHTIFQTTENYITAYAYFDWNADGDFADSYESFMISNDKNINDNMTSISVPANAKKKPSNARFVLRTGSSTAADPCYEYDSYGEVEDYPLEIE